ncbi:MAG: TrkH family potassium uptake protein [Pirellulaceae bacterium]|nr:TrkH family potassium uptake protein [Pirellulaceae bacterium]
MNLRLLAKHLGTICLLIGATMVFSLPWALPQLGQREETLNSAARFETDGFIALLCSIAISVAVGIGLKWWGRFAKGEIYRKEAMAIVGLSWVLATILGALPFILSDTYRSSSVRLNAPSESFQIFDFESWRWSSWKTVPPLPSESYEVIHALSEAGAKGLTHQQLTKFRANAAEVLANLRKNRDWQSIVLLPGTPGPDDRINNYRLQWVRMTITDSMFESQSGFSTTGATVMSDLEDPFLVSHCMLFWRSSTHFLGGLGIIVLFVVILGQGSAGKAMMRAEMPGPSKDSSQSRMQHTAWLFAAMYCILNLVLSIILQLMGLSWFDAICHAFGTMATGGFSTYNDSVGHFHSVSIDFVIILFMGLAGTNFTLLYFVLRFQPGRMFADTEWRTYAGLILIVTLLVILFGTAYHDFRMDEEDTLAMEALNGFRYSLFQVVSIITTTGYGTHNFDAWNSFGRGILFLLMFVGGCAGSTGGGLKVIRHVLFIKILRLEIEHTYHPRVVRPLKIGGRAVEDPELRKNILVYFCLALIVFVLSWLLIITIEPDVTWGNDSQHKLLDTASAIAAMMNNIGPGLGTVGATENYGNFTALAKLHFIWLMMLGRVEFFAIVVLFVPNFWRDR